MTPPFDRRAHRLAGPRHFEAFVLGEAFPLPSRTVTEAHFAAFQTISGDNHPIHYDLPYCRDLGHRGLLAHGFQVLAATASGAGLFPHVAGEALVGFVAQSSRFLAPVYPGDTLYPMLRVAALAPQRTTGLVTLAATVHNQDGALVLEGEQVYLVRRAAPVEA